MNLTAPWNATNGHGNGTHDKIEDVRHVLSREADHLAEVAAQFGREASAHAGSVASDVAKDAQKQTNAAVSRLADVAAAWAPTIAAVGRKKMAQATGQAQSLGHDLSKVRITTEPKRNDATSNVAIVGGLGIGLGLGMAAMYLLDPERGRERRAALKARIAEWTNSSRERIASMNESVTSGMGVEGELPVADTTATDASSYEAPTYETWPEGTRVPTN